MRASVYHAVDDELRDRVRGVQSFMDRQISSLSVPEIRDEFREHSVLGPGGDLAYSHRRMSLKTGREVSGSRVSFLVVFGWFGADQREAR